MRRLLACAALGLAACSGEPSRPLDLLLITLDTTRADRIGCYGRPDAHTPWIDGLAQRGLRFTQAIAPTPLTLPSHASLMTGLYPPAHGVRNNGRFRLDPAHETLAERLSARGYATAAVVGAFVLDARFGLAQGFDHYDDRVPGRRAADSHFPSRDATRVSDAALAWLDGALTDPRRPFFLWVHYFDPHAVYAPPRPWRQRFPEDPYQGEIAYVDAELGRLLETLARRGRLENTLVVLTADHGEGLGEHGEGTHGILTYDSTLRVPLILSNPRLFPEPRVVDDRVVSLVDVLPTLLELLGPGGETGLDGRPLLAGAADPDRAVYFESLRPPLDHGWAPLFGLRRLADKYVHSPEPEYFDLRDDPGELQNLFEGGPPEAAELRRRLDGLLEGWEPLEKVLAREGELSPEDAARLEALGYTRSRVRDSRADELHPRRLLGLERLMWRALSLSHNGRHEEAIIAIETVLGSSPRNGYAWHMAFGVYGRAGRVEDALAAERQALRLDPRPEGFAGLAEVLYEWGRMEEGDAAVEDALRLDPRSGPALISRGLGLSARGREAEALEAYETALRVDPANASPRARQLAEEARKALGDDAPAAP